LIQHDRSFSFTLPTWYDEEELLREDLRFLLR